MSTEIKSDDRETCNWVNAMLTDLYQISMAYAYWHAGRTDEESVFDLYFRTNPFKGEFTVFAGLEDSLRMIRDFSFSQSDVDSLAARFPEWDAAFWPYLTSLDASKVKVYAIQEGTLVFPREPLLRLEGPLVVCQLLETTLLNCVNFASLVATNAARHRITAGADKTLIEFGLRRAQGPDGAMSASRYAYMGGFDGTSNVRAAMLYNIPCKGTHAHSFVVSFTKLSELKTPALVAKDGTSHNFVELVQSYLAKFDGPETNQGELAAFISYAQAYPSGFLALIDTYDTLNSGLINFCAVALALHELGHRPIGIRLDSGDLAYLSRQCRKQFEATGKKFGIDYFGKLNVVASNDLNETVIASLNEQGHSIDTFGIGTHLVTCKAQPALGCVYKLVEINGVPRIKISQDVIKITIPGRKDAYRLYNKEGTPILDLLVSADQSGPVPLKRALCRHPFAANKRAHVIPTSVEKLHSCVFDGKLTGAFPSLEEVRARVKQQITTFRRDHLRHMNPTPFKVSVTSDLFHFIHELWLSETPIHELS